MVRLMCFQANSLRCVVNALSYEIFYPLEKLCIFMRKFLRKRCIESRNENSTAQKFLAFEMTAGPPYLAARIGLMEYQTGNMTLFLYSSPGLVFCCWSHSLAISYFWLWDKGAEVNMLICFKERCPSAAPTLSMVQKWAFPENTKERSKVFLISWSARWLVLAFYNIVPTQMRDEVTGPVIVPRNFHSVIRVLTHNVDKAVGNECAVCTHPLSVGFIYFPLEINK